MFQEPEGSSSSESDDSDCESVESDGYAHKKQQQGLANSEVMKLAEENKSKSSKKGSNGKPKGAKATEKRYGSIFTKWFSVRRLFQTILFSRAL